MRLVSGFGAVVVSVSVAAILLDCRFERYSIIGFNPAWCTPTVEIAESVSVSAGVGFLAFLILEGFGMIIASMWLERERKEAEQRRREEAERSERQRREEAERAEQLRREESERAERRMETSERRAEAAERMAEAAERRAEAAEIQRREESERAERMAEAAERRAESAEQQRREESERAERREERLLALLERRNGGSSQRDPDGEGDIGQG